MAVLTNGLEYRFYSDLDAPNKMDQKPFFSFTVVDFPEGSLPELKKFTKAAFNIDALLSTANELKYAREIKRVLAEQMANPSEDFVRLVAAAVGIPRMTQAVKEQFTALTQRAFGEFVNERLSEKLKAALGTATRIPVAEPPPEVVAPLSPEEIVTTQEETEGFMVIKAILREVVDVKRVTQRDQKSYFGVLLDDNNRKPICRLWFNAKSQKYLGLFDEAKNETRIPLESIDDIYQHADALRETVKRYL